MSNSYKAPPESVREKAFKEADHWYAKQKLWFSDTRRIAVLSVAEFILNQQGYSVNPTLVEEIVQQPTDY